MLTLGLLLSAVSLFAPAGNICHPPMEKVREAVLQQDLIEMRMAIHQFTRDNGSPPQSLQQLVASGYLREIPTDPITRNRDWVILLDELGIDHGYDDNRIADVRSSASGKSTDGSRYDEW
jgi:general secretion pathway protein G